MERFVFPIILGNICRSPAAQGIMEHLAEQYVTEKGITVDSAGTSGGHSGSLPDARMRSAAAQRGYTLAHRSRQLRQADFYDFDMIVVMDDMNYEDVHRLAPSREESGKIFRMADFLRSHPDQRYVPDPYYEGYDGFERVLDLLEDGCSGILEYLKSRDRN